MDYKVWSVMQEVYEGRIKDVNELRSRILTAWDELLVFMRVLKRKADTLNTK